MPADRFDLEEAIVAMGEICDNIDLLQVDGPNDKILADIIACSLVHKLKYDRLWKVFLDVFQLNDMKSSYSTLDTPLDENTGLDYECLQSEPMPSVFDFNGIDGVW